MKEPVDMLFCMYNNIRDLDRKSLSFMKYIINIIVVFDPKEKTLALFNNPLNTVKLSNPASRLFLELIKNNGETIPREDLLKNVWEDYGFTGSNSNLNSYISEIRKNLASLSADLTIIKTIPKVGFRLEADIQVSLQESPEEENNADTDIIISESDINSLHSQDRPRVEDPEGENRVLKKHRNNHVNKWLKARIFLGIAFIFLLLSFYVFFLSKRTVEISQEPYSYLYTTGKCKVFSLDYKLGYSKATLREMAKQDISNEKIDCQSVKQSIFHRRIMPENNIAKTYFIGICSIAPSGKYNHCLSIINHYGASI